MWSSKYDISFGSPSKIGFLDKFPNYKWKISALGELGPSCWLFNLSRGGNPLRELALIGPFSVCFPKGGTTTPRAILTGHDYEITCAAVCAELGLVLSGSTGKSVCGTFVKRVCAVWAPLRGGTGRVQALPAHARPVAAALGSAGGSASQRCAALLAGGRRQRGAPCALARSPDFGRLAPTSHRNETPDPVCPAEAGTRMAPGTEGKRLQPVCLEVCP